MKLGTVLFTVMLGLAATRAYGQSADGSTDDADDAAVDGQLDAPSDAGSTDAGAVSDAAAAPDARSDGASSSTPQDATPSHLFVNESPGCSLGGAPGSGGWQLLAVTFATLAVAGRRRRS